MDTICVAMLASLYLSILKKINLSILQNDFDNAKSVNTVL